MVEDIITKRIEWQTLEYSHKERSADWFWTIGLVAIVMCVIAIWFHNYVFAIFILISGGCLIMFTFRRPQTVNFVIDKEGLTISKDLHAWATIKGFRIKDDNIAPKLLVQTGRSFLPIYTIPLPAYLLVEVKETLLKVITEIEIEESRSMAFMEKLGF